MKGRRLFILTLEPIDKRYTKQWYEYWKPEFAKYFRKVEYIDGLTISKNIEKGRFLDINQTNIWKAVQVRKMGELFYSDSINDGDRFLFMDGWHFGITALRYMAQLNNIPIKIYAYWHAGTYDKWDFIAQAGLGTWAYFNEMGWFKACDGHFVATHFHKSLIMNMFKKHRKSFLSTKIKVVGFPLNWKKASRDYIGNYRAKIRTDTIVFPHRVDKEKNPSAFDRLAKRFPKYEFIKTMEVTKDKAEYYKLLTKAKVSFSASLQETFGIGTVEAMMLGCIPLVPRRLSYIELYDGLFMYSDLNVARKKIGRFIKDYEKSSLLMTTLKRNQEKIQRASLRSFKEMSEVMLRVK